jgi:hypothetical protein
VKEARHANVRQLKHQAKDLLDAVRGGDRDAIAFLREHHAAAPDPPRAQLADAQRAVELLDSDDFEFALDVGASVEGDPTYLCRPAIALLTEHAAERTRRT